MAVRALDVLVLNSLSYIFRGRISPPQTILPEVWDTAVDLFDASRAGVVSDRKRTQKVQEKVRD